MVRALLFRLNTVVVVLAAAGLVLAAAGALLVEVEALGPDDAVPFRWFEDALRDLDGLSGSEAALAFALTVVSGTLGIALAVGNLVLLSPLARGRPSQVTVFLQDGQPVDVPRPVVERRLRAALAQMEGLSDVAARVRGQRAGQIRLQVALTISPLLEDDLRATLGAVRDRAAIALRDEFGLEIGALAMATEMASGEPAPAQPEPAATQADTPDAERADDSAETPAGGAPAGDDEESA